jgi:GT2 family glycosyltransferase
MCCLASMTEDASRRPAMVTIAICTRNRADLLRACLASLFEQIEDLGDVQVLIVDNGSTDHTLAVVTEYADRFSCCASVTERNIGLSHARNRALTDAEAAWVVFLDDDARLLPGYVRRLGFLVREDAFDLVGGLYIPWYREGRKPWFRDRYASNADSICCIGPLSSGRYASGGNCLLRKKAALDAGGFRTDLGMAGSRTGYGEETRLQIEMRRRGYAIGADPALRIEHLAPLHKQSVVFMLGAAWAVGHDRWTTFGERPTLPVLLGVARRIVTRPLAAFYEEVFRESQRSHWQNLVVEGGRPIVGTVAELLAGVRLAIRGSR